MKTTQALKLFTVGISIFSVLGSQPALARDIIQKSSSPHYIEVVHYDRGSANPRDLSEIDPIILQTLAEYIETSFNYCKVGESSTVSPNTCERIGPNNRYLLSELLKQQNQELAQALGVGLLTLATAGVAGLATGVEGTFAISLNMATASDVALIATTTAGVGSLAEAIIGGTPQRSINRARQSPNRGDRIMGTLMNGAKAVTKVLRPVSVVDQAMDASLFSEDMILDRDQKVGNIERTRERLEVILNKLK